MAAATTDRNTYKQYVQRQIAIPLKSATVIPSGVLVMVIAAEGLAVNGADTASGIVMGLSVQAVSYADGDRTIVVEKGAFWLANDGTITQADVGGNATILDNQTVSKAATTTNDIVAGKIEQIDAQLGVLVSIL